MIRRHILCCLAIVTLLLSLLPTASPSDAYAARGTTLHPAAPVGTPVLADIAALGAGAYHTCTLTAGGGVKCWGGNWVGQLGDETEIDRGTPVDVSGLGSGVTALGAGAYHTCALAASGAKCWGDNSYGQLGDGTTTQQSTPVEVDDVDNNVTALAAGYSHTCALTTDGGVKCWGRNTFGQLGDETEIDRGTPVDVFELTSGVTALTAGAHHTCALAAGVVKCWGRNNQGQLGNGTTTNQSTPVEVDGLGSDVTSLAAGDHHTCALTAGGSVKCWGRNYNGQLGDETTTQRETPVSVVGLGSGVTALAGGGSHTCALTAGGGAKCWGYNEDGQLGDGTTAQRLTPVGVSGLGSGVTALAAGDRHTCALTAGGGVRCWGRNNYSQLGDGREIDLLTPVDVGGLGSGVMAPAAGSIHTCVLTAGGGVKCWGRNDYGQLGDGTTMSRSTPVDVIGLASGVTALSAGYSHTCALTAGGGVKCWGYNANGQLGDGTTVQRETPVDVVGLGSGVTALAAGWSHTCALTEHAGVKCWGSNWAGQLGDGTTTNRSTPVGVFELTSGVTTLTAGWAHTCAVKTGEGVKCWGHNANGQLGDGTTTQRETPVDVDDLGDDVTALVTGALHTCALATAGDVQCWGGNGDGQLGDGTTVQRKTPVNVFELSSGVTALTAGAYHTCALMTGGVRCWGSNGNGQLGDGTTVQRETPVDVFELSSGVTALAAGSYHTCALMAGSGVKCWGDNWRGQLGIGVAGYCTTPGTVVDTGSAPTEHAAGRVTLADGQGLAGVTVAAESVEAITDADGYYAITGLLTGTYTLVASYPGYSFSPPSRQATVPPFVTGMDFAAALNAPTLNPIANARGAGSYTVSWSTIAGATYTLQEAADSSFTGPTTLYTNTATSRDFAGKPPGIYYYRVKATEARSDSAWSNTRSVQVLHFAFLPLTLRAYPATDTVHGSENGTVTAGSLTSP
jgi:alpha-tubulin suppressor-like RCC1 family protein